MALKTVRVVAAIIEHEGRILATQRGYGDYAGTYQIDSMSYRISTGQFSNTIVAHKHKPVTYFTLNKSRLNGSDLLA